MPDEDLIKALQFFQGVMTTKDFSMCEKLVTPKKKRRRKSKTIVSSFSGDKCVSRQAAEAGGWPC